MRKYRAAMICVMAVAFLAAAFALDQDGAAFAKTKKYTVTTKELEKGKTVDLKDLPHNHDNDKVPKYKGKTPTLRGFQNFEFTPDGKYVFGIVECETTGPKATHSMIVRCRKTSSAQAEFEDATLLAKYGHGEVLCISQPNLQKEEYNLWVGCTPASGDKGYAREIARVTYALNPTNNKGKIKKVVKITGFQKGNVVKGKAAYFRDKPKVDRVNCAVDPKSNQVMFRVKLIKGKEGYGTRYLSYDYKKLNAALNKVGNKKKYNITKAAKWQKANVYFALTPLDGLQSFDVAGNTIYLAGGNFGKGAQIYAVNYKIYKNGKAKEQLFYTKKCIKKIINLPTKLSLAGKKYGKKDLEIEGMKAVKKGKKADIYVNYLFQGAGLQYGVKIYKFTR